MIQDPGTAPAEQPRTRRARAAVVEAATRRFVDQGYEATAIAQVSADAQVPVATVYRLFGTKVAILEACLDHAIAGDDLPEPVAARPVVREAIGAPTPAAQVAGFVGVMVSINRRISDLYWIVFQAAGGDAGARDLLRSLEAQRGRGQGQLVTALDAAGALRPGLGSAEAGDIVHALMSPETYRLLVTERGWSPDRYAAWLTATLTTQLLG